VPAAVRAGGAAVLSFCLVASAGRVARAGSAPVSSPLRFEVQGAVAPDPLGLVARITLRNSGGATATGVRLSGELTGEEDSVSAEAPVPVGGSTELALHLPTSRLTPGVHPLPLLIDFAAADQPQTPLSQRGWLLVFYGQPAGPDTVRLVLSDLTIRDGAGMVARLSSLDGRGYKVRLRVLTARGLSVPDPVPTVEVPATGTVETRVRLLRGGAPRPSRQGVIGFAEWDDGGLHHTTPATATVDVLPDPAVLPRIRRPLGVAAAVLLLAAGVAEALHARRRRRQSTGGGSPGTAVGREEASPPEAG
jgi:hypothetical protein